MVVPNAYQLANETAVASYDFFQFSSNQGYKTFYLADASGGYLLTTETLYSAIGDITATSGVPLDIDFDYQFKRGVIIEGDLLTNLQVTADVTSGTSTITAIITTNVYHVSGSTETLLGTANQTWTTGSLGAGTNEKKILFFKVPLTKKAFKANDKIRFNVTTNDPGSNHRIFILCDPANRTSIPYGTGDLVTFANSKAIVPFRITG